MTSVSTGLAVTFVVTAGVGVGVGFSVLETTAILATGVAPFGNTASSLTVSVTLASRALLPANVIGLDPLMVLLARA